MVHAFSKISLVLFLISLLSFFSLLLFFQHLIAPFSASARFGAMHLAYTEIRVYGDDGVERRSPRYKGLLEEKRRKTELPQGER